MPRLRSSPTPRSSRISRHCFALASLGIAVCVLSPRRREARAYTPPLHRSMPRGSSKFRLFGLANDASVGGLTKNATMIHDVLSNNQDRLRYSSPKSNPKTDEGAVFGRMINNRRATGLSSSSSPPLSVTVPSLETISPFGYTTPTKETTWKERLVDASNFASLLCVLDCTLLPLVSIAIPALSWVGGAVTAKTAAAIVTSNNNFIETAMSSIHSHLPALSHGVALWFVIPVGLLTSIVNYVFGHKQVRFSLFSLLGLALIYLANSSAGTGIPNVDAWLRSGGIVMAAHAYRGEHVHDACGAVVGAATGMLAHTCPEGLAHRLTNTLGCAFLLGSNHYGRKYSSNQGCAASALAEAWGGDGDDKGRPACIDPGCMQCEVKESYITSRMGGETFFQWERTQVDKSNQVSD